MLGAEVFVAESTGKLPVRVLCRGVPRQLVDGLEYETALLTGETAAASAMNAGMFLQAAALGEGAITLDTLEGFLSCVGPTMPLQVTPPAKPAATDSAGVRLVACVCACVGHQVAVTRKLAGAIGTLEVERSLVFLLSVPLQLFLTVEALIATGTRPGQLFIVKSSSSFH